MILAALLTVQALQPAARQIRAPHRIVQSASATDATERESYLQYNAHAWRGVCRSVVVDATRRRVDLWFTQGGCSRDKSSLRFDR